MAQESAPISVFILDREYQFTCEPDEREALKAAATYLDEKMRETKAAGNLLSLERVAVMTSLNMADELLKLRKYDQQRRDQVDHRIRSLADQLDDALRDGMD